MSDPRRTGAGPSGVLVVAKPAGMTSFDVVAAVRRALRVRRAGHGGTLDPGATGVLPILVGEATKLMGYLADLDKEYRVTVRFGVVTDTLDATGTVLSTPPVPPLDRAVVARAAARFVGVVRQVPPMYSARRHEGQRLYALARRGIEVEREAREVTIHAITVEDVTETTATLTVRCGKGTYIRVLAADLAAVLDTGGSVERLVRTRVGPFGLDGAVSWEAVRSEPPEVLWTRVQLPEAALQSWERVTLAPDDESRFLCGQPVVVGGGAADGQLVRVHAADGPLLGVGEVTSGGARVRPVRILHVDRPRSRVLPA